jgi:hypothetical protein
VSDESEDPVTDNGIIVSANTEDFLVWTWTNDARVEAANLVRDILIEGARIQFSIHGDSATALFGTFDYEIMLEYPIARMMDYWFETRDLESEDRQASEILLRDLENADQRLRTALES